MKRVPFLLSLAASCTASFSADLKPDATTDIPASAQRPVVVTLPATAARSPLHPPVQTDLPAGFELSTVAAPPLVTHPIMGCLDDRGRLFVGDATGVNWNNKQLDANPPNRILMLEDTDGDGIYDKSTIFADKMTFPQGGCWLNGSLYVCSPPGLWKLTDTDGDGVADQREMIVSGFQYTGNAADVHGPWLHPSGRLYWCHGRKGHKVVGKDGIVVHEGLASGIWSCKPDGTDVRWHSLGCGDNPVKVDFTPEGEVIGVQNLYYSQPRGDTIVHWLYGGVYERADQMKAIQGLPRTIDQMPVMYNFGHVAVSGCCFAKTNTLYPPGPLQFFVTHFNTQRLVRMELTPDGATFKARENEFLTIHDPDAHLTDVLEAKDGSLIVLNTGGWFRIGCPSSLMAKPDVLGSIYRIKRSQPLNKTAAIAWGAPSTAKSIWADRSEKELIRDLATSNDPAELCRTLQNVSLQIDHGVSFTEKVYQALAAGNSLYRYDQPEFEHAAILATAKLLDPGYSTTGRLSFAHGNLKGAGDDLNLEAKRDNIAAITRVMIQEARDPAGADSAKRQELWRGVVLGAIRDLNFIDAGKQSDRLNLEPCHLTLQRAYGVVDLAHDAISKWLAASQVSAVKLNAIEITLNGRLDSPAAQEILTRLLSHSDETVRQRAVQILATQNNSGVNDAWLPPLEKMLAENPTPLLLDAIKKLKSDRFDEKLQALASDLKRPLAIRLKALDSMKGVKLTGDTFAMVKGVLADAASSAAARIQAAAMISRAPSDKAQQLALAPLLASVGPVELKELLPSFRKTKDAEVARAFAGEVARNPAIASQQESFYRTVFSDQSPEIFETIILPALHKANEASEAKKRTLPSLAEKAAASGHAAEGRAIYESGKGTCIACHQIGDKGRSIGPNLTKIGAIRTERDLVESIIFPSNTIARDYEAHVIETTGGETLVGVIKSHTAEGLLVVDVAGQEKNVPQTMIASDTTLPTSLMPMGLDQTLSEQEFLDLVAFLRSLK